LTRQQLLTKAWTAYNKERWTHVVDLTTKILTDLERPATVEQESYGPRTLSCQGPVAYRPQTLSSTTRGLVNDVATALFMRGEAYRQLDRLKDARSDWEKVMTFTHAVTYDDQTDEFWLTKDAAENKLFQLDRAEGKQR
jgi:hypothetical protein